jgi:hypothetical protein
MTFAGYVPRARSVADLTISCAWYRLPQQKASFDGAAAAARVSSTEVSFSDNAPAGYPIRPISLCGGGSGNAVRASRPPQQYAYVRVQRVRARLVAARAPRQQGEP